MIRLFIISMEKEIRGRLRRVLQGEPDIQVAGTVCSTGEALSRLQHSPVDVVLVQSALPKQECLWFIRRLLQLHPELKILTISVDEQAESLVPYLEAGAVGYTQYSDSLAELAKRIRAAARGESLISPEVAYTLASRLAELDRNLNRSSMNSSHALLPVDQVLSQRQKEVLACLQEGHTNQEIANLLRLELGTVKNHVHAILTKLRVSSRHEAAALASLLLDGHPNVYESYR